MTAIRYIEDDPHEWGPWNPRTRMRRCLDCLETQSEADYHQHRWVNRPVKRTGVKLVIVGPPIRGGEMIAAMTTFDGEVVSQTESGGTFYTHSQCDRMREQGLL